MTTENDQLIKERLEQQVVEYGKQIGKALTVEQYLDLLYEQTQKTGTGITQRTRDTLLQVYNRVTATF